MNRDKNIREMTLEDSIHIIDYFHDSQDDFLLKMGTDRSKLPPKKEWLEIMNEEKIKDDIHKDYFNIVWLLDNNPVGHSTLNKIHFGREGFVHLHLWNNQFRNMRFGLFFFAHSIDYFFERFKLKIIICEPSSTNSAPNRTLKRLGFEFRKEYETVPGWLNFKQKVCRWEMTCEGWTTIAKELEI
jgi:RimJ/RimL family protein N-acetyltransferase